MIKKLLLALFVALPLNAAVADLVIFSYNRPIQLYALLESRQTFMSGVGEIHVIYRADTEEFSAGYDGVINDFPRAVFHKQGANPRADFKPLTMAAIFDSPSEHVIFAVDDIVVKDFVDLSHSIAVMEKEEAYVFHIRMGQNLNWCYSLNEKQPLPPMRQVDKDVFAWVFADGTQDWNYPHSVDMGLFRKKDIRAVFESLSFESPNTLEGRWADLAGPIMGRTGLCYTSTKVVNLPLNVVQSTHKNRNMQLFTPDELLAKFNEGKKIDIAPLFQIVNEAVHTVYTPTFVERLAREEL